jgi:MFS family permease
MIIPALFAIPLAPLYLFSGSFTVIVVAFVLQGAAGSGGMFGQIPAYLNERFPTEVRATGTAFCYHQGAIWGGFCAPVLAYFATTWHLGLAIPMMVGTTVGAASFIFALLVSPDVEFLRDRHQRAGVVHISAGQRRRLEHFAMGSDNPGLMQALVVVEAQLGADATARLRDRRRPCRGPRRRPHRYRR